MKRQIVKLINHGTYLVIHDDSQKVKPYRVYYISGNHRTQLISYGDLASYMYYLYQITEMNNKE